MEKNLPPTCSKCILSDLRRDVGGTKWERHGYSLTIHVHDAKDQPKELHMARRHGMAAVGGKVYFEMTGSELAGRRRVRPLQPWADL
ncbi:hypothetical protein EJB05_34655, partial [Eragrostis curvula]